ncbi:hypothetical protein QJS10_CPB12g01586 [Acorus calamus]|uniref:B box-type domain-containing protein n=1 Tax=Acorus calamus TaxID=4465 RepID=A0AAV9DNN0_ACOCL|nr:hypothetical protein QJS10_CPB12g01586 [Acorus calamus]
MAPYSSVSKSLGNVVDPDIVIAGRKGSKDEPGYGADVLRLWVSSVDYTGDVMIGAQVLRQMSDIYRKLRGTLRYLLSNLHDWKPENAVLYGDLPMIDRHALFQLENVVKAMKESYENYQFYKIFQIVQRFAIVDLSNFYFDVAKDRLYVGGTNKFYKEKLPNCSCRTSSIHHQKDAWQNLPFEHIIEGGSVAKFVFESKWPDVNEEWLAMPVKEVDFWRKLLEMRTEVNKVLETARSGRLIGSSLEAKVYLHTSDSDMAARLQEMCSASSDADRLNRIFITSQVEVVSSLDGELVASIPYTGKYLDQGLGEIWIGVSRADGDKCERCWNYSPQVGSFEEHPTLCTRCYDVIGVQPLAAMAGSNQKPLSVSDLPVSDSNQVQVNYDTKRETNPEWVETLLNHKFFEVCDVHRELHKREINIFCIDCGLCFCSHCFSLSSHSPHRHLRIRRSMYQSVVNVDDLHNLFDCSKIQISDEALNNDSSPTSHLGREAEEAFPSSSSCSLVNEVHSMDGSDDEEALKPNKRFRRRKDLKRINE